MAAAKQNIHQRLAAVMKNVTYIQKEKKQGMQYSIVSHDVVTAKVRPALLEQGVVYYPVRCEHSHNGNRAECSMTIRFVNIDEPADCFEVQTFGYGVDAQDKGPGKAMSYAVKYALLKALGLETGDDADHDSADHTEHDPAIPPFDATAAKDRISKAMDGCKTIQQLNDLWKAERGTANEVGRADRALGVQLYKKRDVLKGALPDENAPPPNGSGNAYDDEIPF